MKEVHPNLFIGKDTDYERNISHKADWAVLHASKEPYHRRAVGYAGLTPPVTHPEFNAARRANHLSLNFVNTDSLAFISRNMIDTALDFVQEYLDQGNSVLVHSYHGASRAPSIGLLYLAKFTNTLSINHFSEAEDNFRTLYPPYKPQEGIHQFMKLNWVRYTTKHQAARSEAAQSRV